MRTALISAADGGYFQHLKGLILSIKRHVTVELLDICVIDLGLSAEQRAELRGLGISEIAEGRWDFDFPLLAKTPRHAQGMSVRPFLRTYFPGYDLYVWLDADCWLQDGRVIDLLLAGAAESDIAVVPELHRAYVYLFGLNNLYDFTRECYIRSFGDEDAAAMAMRPIINAGVFAMRAGSPVWERYGERVAAGYRRHPHKWTEQCAMNLVLFFGGVTAAFLPPWCNWICCYALPVYDPATRALCEPLRPWGKLSLIHLTGANKPGIRLRTPSGHEVEQPIDYHGHHRGFSPA